MINVEYITGIPNEKADGVTIRLTLEEAIRLRAALSDLDDEDLDNYGRIIEHLRTALPHQRS